MSVNLTRPMQPSGLFSYILPSLADVLFISLLLSLAYGTPSLRLLNDPGIGWHIRTGEWMLRNHAVPHADLFSYATRRPWFAWEWLFDVAVAKVHGWWGLNGVLVGGALVIALTFSLLFRMMLRRGAAMLPALTFTILAVLASTIHCLARPHLFSWLFTLLCWYVLEEKRNTVWLWAIPGIVLVWVNVHGGFLIAFALLGLTWAGELGTLAFGEPEPATRRCCVRLGRVLAAALVAGFFNPYGMQLYIHIYQYLGDSFLMHHIQEMQSPDFHSFAGRCFAVLLLFAATIATAQRRRLRAGDLLILVFFAYSALYAVRNVPLACIVMGLTIAPLLAPGTDPGSASRLRLWLGGFSDRMGAMELASRGHVWPILLVVSTLVACGNHGQLFGRQLVHANFNSDRFPLRAVAYLEEHPFEDPIFTTDAWGGFVIYRGWPRLHTVADDRHDMYGSDYMKQYLKIVEGNPDWNAQLHTLGARSVLIPSTSALGSLLRLSPEWRLAYDDGQAALFVTAR